jgi:YVTN family beta-propeller protein
LLFVGNEDNAALTAIDIASRSVAFQVSVGKEPEGVAQSPDGRQLIVTSEDENVVNWIDLTTRKVVATVETALRPRHAEFTGDGKQVWIAAEAGGVVQIADTASHAILDTIHFDPPGVKDYQVLPCGIRFTPDGATAVVALGRANTIALVDVASRKVRAYVPVGKRVHLALSADGTRAYTANGLSDDVTVVDLATAKAVATVPAGAGPWGVAVAP